jgi:hypothetical protein
MIPNDTQLDFYRSRLQALELLENEKKNELRNIESEKYYLEFKIRQLIMEKVKSFIR